MNRLINCIVKNNINDIPVWFMRQAGRYLPEFMEIRKKNKDFVKLCLNSELAFNSAKFLDISAGVASSLSNDTLTSSSSILEGSTSQAILFFSRISFLTPLLEAKIILIYFFLSHESLLSTQQFPRLIYV